MTKPITFDVAYHGQSTLLGMRTALNAKAMINRQDFGLGQGMMVQVAASWMVAIEIHLEAAQQSVEVHEVVATAG